MVGHEPVKTLLGCVLGLMLTTIGLDATSGAYRFTFNQPELHDGIEFIVLVIGLFSISEVLLMLESQVKGTLKPLAVSGKYPSWAEISLYLVAFRPRHGHRLIIGPAWHGRFGGERGFVHD